MIAVILAGGFGTRISEETVSKPKPMVEIGGKPIIWHIMKIFSTHNINNFIICCGYKGYVIKEYFANYFLHMSDVTFDMERNEMKVHKRYAEPWKITLVDTGDNTMTGGRLKRIYEYLKNEDCFCFTYGDGLANIDITKLVEYHKFTNKLATVTAVQPPGRFGTLNFDGNDVVGFAEKPRGDGGWVNGGFFVLSPKALDYIKGDATHWEGEPLNKLADDNQLSAFKHHGFWMPMDTLRDKIHLEEYWESNQAPWKVWE